MHIRACTIDLNSLMRHRWWWRASVGRNGFGETWKLDFGGYKVTEIGLVREAIFKDYGWKLESGCWISGIRWMMRGTGIRLTSSLRETSESAIHPSPGAKWKILMLRSSASAGVEQNGNQRWDNHLQETSDNRPMSFVLGRPAYIVWLR